jgi:hypothetical protein
MELGSLYRSTCILPDRRAGHLTVLALFAAAKLPLHGKYSAQHHAQCVGTKFAALATQNL